MSHVHGFRLLCGCQGCSVHMHASRPPITPAAGTSAHDLLPDQNNWQPIEEGR